MSNMSYCRMENTYNDLSDAYGYLNSKDLSEDEKKYRDQLIALCSQIHNEYAEEDDSIEDEDSN